MGYEPSPGDEVYYMFQDLGRLSDSYLSQQLALVDDYADILLSRIEKDRLTSTGVMWWLTAVGIALEEPVKAFRELLVRRQEVMSEYAYAGERYRDAEASVSRLVTTRIEETAVAIRAKTVEALVAGLRGEELAKGLRDMVLSEVKQFIEYMDSAFSMHDRLVFREFGEETGAKYWIYAGPADNRNRTFCRDIVRRNSVFTPRGIDKLNDHPDLHSYVPPNVSLLCGGYKCRHVWLPTDKVPEGAAVED